MTIVSIPWGPYHKEEKQCLMVQSTTRLGSQRLALPLTSCDFRRPNPPVAPKPKSSPWPGPCHLSVLISSHFSQLALLQLPSLLFWSLPSTLSPHGLGTCSLLSPLYPSPSVHMAPFLLPSGPLLDCSILNCNTLSTPCCCLALVFFLTLIIIYCTIKFSYFL